MQEILKRADEKLEKEIKLTKKDLRPEYCWKCGLQIVLCPLPGEKFVFCGANENVSVFKLTNGCSITLENSMSPVIRKVANGKKCKMLIESEALPGSSRIIKEGEAYIKKIMGW